LPVRRPGRLDPREPEMRCLSRRRGLRPRLQHDQPLLSQVRRHTLRRRHAMTAADRPEPIRSTSPAAGSNRQIGWSWTTARAGTPVGATYNATPEQYEEAVTAAVAPSSGPAGCPRSSGARPCARSAQVSRGDAMRSAGSSPWSRASHPGRADRSRPGILTFRIAPRPSASAASSSRWTSTPPPAAGPGSRAASHRPHRGHQPFNFPLNLAAHKLARHCLGQPDRAQAAVQGPLTMLTVAEIVAEAGLPEGAVSILPMTRELGDRMSRTSASSC